MEFLRSLAGWLDRPNFPWKSLIVTFSIGQYCLENFLSWRQYRVLQGKKIPKQLENEVDQKTFDKSQVGRFKYHALLRTRLTLSGLWSRQSQVCLRLWSHLSNQVSRDHSL